jgi:hypothetical protein
MWRLCKMQFFAVALLLAQGLSGLPVQEPSIVPMLLNPGKAKQLLAAPGGRWAFAMPKDAREIGRDHRSQTLSLGLPVGRSFCQLRLTTVAMPSGHAGSLAMSALGRLKKLAQVKVQAARKISPSVIRLGAHYNALSDLRMARFVLQWFQVEAGFAMIVHLEAPASFEAACAGRAENLVLSMRRVGS